MLTMQLNTQSHGPIRTLVIPLWRPGNGAGRPLRLQRRGDHLAELTATRRLVQERPTRDAVAEAKQAKAGSPVALDEHSLGLDTGDAFLMKLLRSRDGRVEES